ncbi:hypothetical protein H7X69_02500 [Candidatus Saccharibacteria bacterium]|nr:hypothetical protein [Candidatus Saccharibacteria bacterium]
MKSSLLAIRSIGAEFANRVFYPVLIIGIVVAIVLVALIVWLATLSEWWLLLAIPIVMVICVGAGLLAIVKLVIRYVTPPQSYLQKKAVKQFVDKLQGVAETVATPKFILLFQIVRDIAAPRENGFIGTLSSDTLSLRGDFKELKGLFDQRKD